MTPYKKITFIKTENLCVGYREKKVLSDISISFSKGSFISLLGPNGAGKTTFLRTISRLLEPVSGTIFIDGHSLLSMGHGRLAKLRSVVLTEQVSPGLFTAFEFAALGRYPHTGFLGKLTKNDKKAVVKAFELVDAKGLEARQITTLSDGEKQKILIARALCQEPRLIILDEPTVHLDLKHRVQIMSILRRLCREKQITVIASLHDVDIASKISDYVALIKNGKIGAFGRPEEILNENKVAGLYDFKGAHFSPGLGSIEITGTKNGYPVFVAGGMGTGAKIYRLLAKYGFKITTGILHSFDLDFHVASSLGSKIISINSMEPVDETSLNKAFNLIQHIDYIIDTGFKPGTVNNRNLELLAEGARRGKYILTMRSGNEIRKILKEDYSRIICCKKAAELVEFLNKMPQEAMPGNKNNL